MGLLKIRPLNQVHCKFFQRHGVIVIGSQELGDGIGLGESGSAVTSKVIGGATLVAQGTAIIIEAIAKANASAGMGVGPELVNQKSRRNSSEGGLGIQGLTVKGVDIHDASQVLGVGVSKRVAMLLKEQVGEGVAHFIRVVG